MSPSRLRILVCLSTIFVGVLAISGFADAATTTQRDDTMRFPTPAVPARSTITVPPGLPPVAKVELPDVKLSAGGAGLEVDLQLAGPGGTSPPFDLASDACTLYAPSDPLTFTDSAAATVGTNCGGPVKPEDTRTLAFFNGGPSSGPWTLTAIDDDTPGGPGSDYAFSGWGLRITYAALTLQASGSAQKLSGDKLSFEAGCNADCTVTVTQGATGASGLIPKGGTATIEATLPKQSVKPLRKKLKRKSKTVELGLTATDAIGDSATASVSIPLKKKKRKKQH
jgi:hypothetical protein